MSSFLVPGHLQMTDAALVNLAQGAGQSQTPRKKSNAKLSARHRAFQWSRIAAPRNCSFTNVQGQQMRWNQS